MLCYFLAWPPAPVGAAWNCLLMRLCVRTSRPDGPAGSPASGTLPWTRAHPLPAARVILGCVTPSHPVPREDPLSWPSNASRWGQRPVCGPRCVAESPGDVLLRPAWAPSPLVTKLPAAACLEGLRGSASDFGGSSQFVLLDTRRALRCAVPLASGGLPSGSIETLGTLGQEPSC